jgi:DNA repair protein RadC
MRSPRSLWLTDIERGSAHSAYARRAHNTTYAELCISGDPTPSHDDARLTLRLCAAADVLDIGLLDHVIVGEADRYYSFREAGAMNTFPC